MDETPNKNEFTPDHSTNPLENRYNPDLSPFKMNSQSPINDLKSHSKQRKSRKERKTSISKIEIGFT
jgi:hypothetical protein